MSRSEAGQRGRYLDAVEALAARVFDSVMGRGSDDDLMERALAEVRRLEGASGTEHAWIFRDAQVLAISDHVFDALELPSDGRREWLQADLGSAVAAVARYDVLSSIAERVAAVGLEEMDADVAMPLGGDGEA